MSRLIVASNRIPSQSPESGAGGLAVALEAALEESGGLWFGWSGDTRAAPSARPEIGQRGRTRVASLDLTPDELEGYYEEFSNRALWPLFHGRLDLARFDHGAHRVYRAVNVRFAEALAPMIQESDRVWVHDYHMIPLATELRKLGVKNAIGFFLHIPFPSIQSLERLPWIDEIVNDLCAYDLVGFQTRESETHFCELVSNELGGGITRGLVSLGDKKVRAGAFPIGIDTAAFANLAGSNRTARRVERLRQMLAGQALVIGVDRLDYTKGLQQRFLAFERLLEEDEDLWGQVSLLQIAAPSREAIAEYQSIKAELEALVGRINGRFSTVEWTPLRYINRTIGHEQLAALYRGSTVGLVTPLCDGMNLVAKEFVAAQQPDDPGVLVLSRFAGAAEQLTDALLVNPHDPRETAGAIRQALWMPLAERRRRWQAMMQCLEANDVHRWWRAFLSALDEAHGQIRRTPGPQAA